MKNATNPYTIDLNRIYYKGNDAGAVPAACKCEGDRIALLSILERAHANGRQEATVEAFGYHDAPPRIEPVDRWHPTRRQPTIGQANRALLSDLGVTVPPMMRPGVQVIDRHDIGVGVPVASDPYRNFPDLAPMLPDPIEPYDAPGDHDGRGAAR